MKSLWVLHISSILHSTGEWQYLDCHLKSDLLMCDKSNLLTQKEHLQILLWFTIIKCSQIQSERVESFQVIF